MKKRYQNDRRTDKDESLYVGLRRRINDYCGHCGHVMRYHTNVGCTMVFPTVCGCTLTRSMDAPNLDFPVEPEKNKEG